MMVPGDSIGRLDITETYDYKDLYPEGLDISPDGELHAKIITEVTKRANESFEKMSARHDIWKKIDRNLTAYVPSDTEEDWLKAQDSRKPTSIVIPMSFAIRESLLTYLVQSLLGDVFFRYEGVGPEDSAGALLMTHLVQQQCLRSKAELAFMTQWSDALTYGFGVCAPVWHKEVGRGYEQVVQYKPDAFGQQVPVGVATQVVDKVLWEGNKFYTIDPYYFLPDPNVSITNVQDGEFVGWLESTNKMGLLHREVLGHEELFNCRYIDACRGRSLLKSEAITGREDRHGGETYLPKGSTGEPVDVTVMYVTLIPAEWGVGDGEYPEKWVFMVANDALVIKAQKLELAHDLYPLSVCAPDYDGYTISPTSRMELVYGQQETLDWLISSHIKNVRKTVNNTYIVDPMLVEEADVKRILSQPGGYVRLRESAWGNGVAGAMEQLKTTDITRGNIADAGYISSMMERVSSAPGSVQGVFDDAPERRTATEYSGTKGSAQARLSRLARVVSAMSMRDLGYMAAVNTQQFMTEPTYIKTAGDLLAQLDKEFGITASQGRIKISPHDLDINFDISPLDGNIPAEQDGKLSLELMQIAAQNPAAFGVDLQKYFAALARKYGEKNIDNYLLPMQMVPPEQLEQQQQQGGGEGK